MFERIGKFVDKVEGYIITSTLIAASILTFTQVVFRYGFNYSIFWAEEVILYLIIAMSFIATSMGIRRGAHISVDILQAAVPKSWVRFFVCISAFLGILFGLALFFYGGRLFLVTLSRGQLSPALRMPVAWIYVFIPFSAVLQIFRYCELIGSTLKKGNETQATDSPSSAVIQ